MISVTRPSRSMRMNALGEKGEADGAGSSKPRSRPPPTVAPMLRNSRRDTRGPRAMSACRRALDRGADAGVRAAAADVSRHRRFDVGVRRTRFLREQRGGSHDLTRLAIVAL